MKEALDDCVARLPSLVRQQFQQPQARTRVRLTGAERARWRECAARERDRDDAIAIQRLATALMALQVAPDAMGEAVQIATTLVHTTRAEAERSRMVGSPLFNNFLIHVGVKHRGYCYQWAEALLQAFPSAPLAYFERHWGGANIGRVTENNAIVITARGAPFATGIVYDAWRGAGRPWWRRVEADHYRWTQRYSEAEVLSGAAW